MTSERLSEMFEGDFTEMTMEKVPLLSMVGRAKPIKHGKAGSEDTLRHERKFNCSFLHINQPAEMQFVLPKTSFEI